VWQRWQYAYVYTHPLVYYGVGPLVLFIPVSLLVVLSLPIRYVFRQRASYIPHPTSRTTTEITDMPQQPRGSVAS
jgi:hypothetical protein